jgi:hypothetical protein
MSDVRLSDDFYHYIYDPTVNGYNEMFFQTLTGAPSVTSGAIVFNAASAQTSGEYLYGTFEFEMKIPAVPTAGDVRNFGLGAAINGNTHKAYFDFSGDVFSTVTYGAWGSSFEQNIVTWINPDWTNVATKFVIKWYKEKVEFWIAGIKVSTHFSSIPETRPLPLFIKNSNVDNVSLVSLQFLGVHKVTGMFGEGTGGGAGGAGGAGTSYSAVSIRTSAVLTNSYVAATVIGPGSGFTNLQKNNQLLLYVDFTVGQLTDALIKIEFSDDGLSYYQETVAVQSSGTLSEYAGEHKIAATGKYRIAAPIVDKFIKVSAKGTGVVTDSLLALKAIIGSA